MLTMGFLGISEEKGTAQVAIQNIQFLKLSSNPILTLF